MKQTNTPCRIAVEGHHIGSGEAHVFCFLVACPSDQSSRGAAHSCPNGICTSIVSRAGLRVIATE